MIWRFGWGCRVFILFVVWDMMMSVFYCLFGSLVVGWLFIVMLDVVWMKYWLCLV